MADLAKKAYNCSVLALLEKQNQRGKGMMYSIVMTSF